MRARFLSGLLLMGVFVGAFWICESTPSIRIRRQVSNNFPGPPAEAKAYKPPISLGAQSVPVASSATLQNSYQPPISLIRSNEYQSPLNAPQNPYSGNVPRNYQPQPISGPQSYVLPNQPHHQTHSVQYIPPANLQQSFSVFQQPPSSSQHQPATSFSVHQQPPSQASQGQQTSFAILSDNSGLPQSTAERTYSTHSKVVASAHVPQQAIHKAPASEIQPEKGSAAKEKDAAKDEYVVYYYYYYDNDTTANNNLSLNFDDIPSLEGYDNDKLSKEPEKSASARTLAANVNSLAPAKAEKDGSQSSDNSASQPRSVGETYARQDRSHSKPLDETLVQPLKPVSNVFRYGSNEVPRFPVLPNFIVTELPTTSKPEIITPDTLTSESPTTQPAQPNAHPDLKNDDSDDDDLNNVLDNTSDAKAIDEKAAEEESITTTTTTTTEPPTTTEEPTTTTEKSRRRPSLGGGRRRFNPSPSSSFSSNRNRQTSSRQSSTSSTTSTTTTRPPTRRSFQANRVRPRPSIGSNRPRPGSRTSEENDDKIENKVGEATTVSTTPSSRSRFTSASPRRFQSSRSRSQSTISTSTTTRAPPGSTVASRARTPVNRPRPNPITRNRPARPGFLRPRPGSEPEETETTTVVSAPTEEETSPESTKEELSSTNDESNETEEEEEETSEEETEEPTTTERSRFSALFRPRNRNALGNRPRPVIGNRPSRS